MKATDTPVYNRKGFEEGETVTRCLDCGKEIRAVVLRLGGMKKEVRRRYCNECALAWQRMQEPEAAPIDPTMAKLAAGIPQRFLKCQHTPSDFTAVVSGKGLYISGKAGVGKTYRTAGLAGKLVELEYDVCFTTSSDLFARLRDSYSGKTTEQVVSDYTTAEFLFIDDLGKEPPTAWVLSMLFRIIDTRYASQLPTVVNTQFAPSQLAARLSSEGSVEEAEAIVSRLLEDCTPLVMEGENRRLA